MLYHLNQSAVGFGHFFTLKIASEALGLKNEKSHNGAKNTSNFVLGEMSQWCFCCFKSAPLWLFSRTDMKHLYDISPSFPKPHHYDISPEQTCSTFVTFLLLSQNRTIMTFLQNRHAAPLWLFSRTDMQHLCDFSLRIKKTRIFGCSTRSEALRTIQYLIPAGSENIRMVRKFQNFDQNSKF